MFEKLYFKLLHDLKSGDKNTLVYKHHIDFVNQKPQILRRRKIILTLRPTTL
ncbi:MAG: hypothetical protein L6V93_07885 [Clostridiales bacterium]|nr:MAG: hypothetical protein L6V93_07885 [Clostridiales bacterium]